MAAPRTLLLIPTVALFVALPTSSAPVAGPPTQVWIDVSTHSIAGMPDLGAMGGFASKMMGAGQPGPIGYPQSRSVPVAVGKVLDIAMYNSLRPGVAAEDQVPAGLAVGKSLALLPPAPDTPGADHDSQGSPQDIEVTLRQYWGCGASVRPGQPKIMKIKVKAGAMQTSGSVAPGQIVPDRDIDAGPGYALWPNQKKSRGVSDGSSMVGQHRIVGDGVPASLQFALDGNADFMPKIALQSQGELAGSMQLQWQPVDRARGYFLNAVAVQDEHNFVTWSSAEIPGAGRELVDYLTGPSIDRWIKQKVLLAPATTGCAIPAGIFKPMGNAADAGGVASLDMVAYGPETNLVWPERPANPKTPWKPEWTVRVRTKSTTTAMLGMDMGGMGNAAQPGDNAQPAKKEENVGKKLLKGLFGGGL